MLCVFVSFWLRAYSLTAMDMRQEGQDLVIECPAKINLFLEVVGPRPDKFHDLITIMQAVSLCDELRISPAEDARLTLECDQPSVPTDNSNLALRAAHALRGSAGKSPGCRLTLKKNIAVGGGMGGGSSNAAGALLGLNHFWRLGLSKNDLHGIAATLGSDINFFLEGGTALCTGRGEKVQPLPVSWPLHYVLVFPGFPVSTAKAFHAMKKFLTPFLKDVTIALKALEQKDFDALRDSLFNRLEAPVFDLYPELAGLKRKLDTIAPGRVLLSGSGSTLFCMCLDPEEAARIETAIRKLGHHSVYRAVSQP